MLADSPRLSVAWFNYGLMEVRQSVVAFGKTLPVALAASVCAVGLITAAISACGLNKSAGNVSMIYLIAVTGSAIMFGRLAAVFTSIVAFLALDFFFTDPQFHLTVSHPAEWLALCVFLFTAIVTGQLTALVQARAKEAELSRREATALAEASWAIASQSDRDAALATILGKIVPLMQVEAACIVDSRGTILASHNNGEDSVAYNNFLREAASATAPAERLAEEDGVNIDLKVKSADASYCRDRLYIPLLTHLKLAVNREQFARMEAKAAALTEADRLKTALLSMVSHDFRSPLTSIKTSVGTLIEQTAPVDPQSQSALLHGIEHETDRLNRLVGNVLDLSRLEAGAWMPRKEPTHVEELISATLDSFSAEENQRITVEIDRAIREISVDSVQTVQVLKNLVENALKYSSPDTDVVLVVKAENEEIVFEVLDRGVGIPVGAEQTIFEPFYRAPYLKEGSIPGLGVGLAVCRGLIIANGGRLVAENRKPKGAVFRVSFPKSSVVQ